MRIAIIGATGMLGHRAAGKAASVNCRPACGACCIAPSISSAIPGMPDGKPAGVRCVQLTEDLRCALFGDPRRPTVCASLRPHEDMCGVTREHALTHLAWLEVETSVAAPGKSRLSTSARA